MRVLKAIDAAKAKGMKADEMKESIDKLCAQFLPLRDHVLPELEEDLRKDQVSHYVLRMAYSVSNAQVSCSSADCMLTWTQRRSAQRNCDVGS